MIERIYVVLEALSIVICLHYLYGKKIQLDIATAALLAIDMILMQTIYFYRLPQTLSMFIYPIIIVYCGVEFGFNWKKLIVNNILCMIIVASVQFVSMILVSSFSRIQTLHGWELILINLLAFTIIVAMRKINLNKVSVYLQDSERLLVISLFCTVVITGYCLFQYKLNDSFGIGQYILFFVIIILICILAVNLAKYKVKAKENETELKMYKLYEESFSGLIEAIRLRQHEFDNHINAIYSQHYLYKTYDELVKVQREYCSALDKENHFNKLLSKGNSAVIGFLYGKFMEIDKMGISIGYSIHIRDLKLEIPVYKLVELLGNLIDNAVEAIVSSKEKRKLFVSIIENSTGLEVEVRNESDFIEYDSIQRFFNKGYSQKGAFRGMGLYNVKRICDEYRLKLYCTNKTINNQNWFTFMIESR